MVFLSLSLLAVKEIRKPRKYLRTKFMDTIRLHIKGGTGGTGLPKYGGLGGQGGCVYCVGREGTSLSSLHKFRMKSVCAGHGEDSRKLKIVGDPGKDVKLEVPPGITVYGENGKILGQIDKEDDQVILARGGPGGKPDNNFLGHAGQVHHVRLDLKLIADIGLVGFPNAGKSSLLKSISKAKPRIANYPFTTIKPNVGIVQYEDMRSISLADLPGLIEGAHLNIGLGHQFLRHVERTKLLLFVVDVQGFSLSEKHLHRSCLETVLLLNKELELYNVDLLEKPAILAINKMDTPGAVDIFENIKSRLLNIKSSLDSLPEEIIPEKLLSFKDIIGISALEGGESIQQLKIIIRKRLDEFAEENNPDIVDASDLLRRNKAKVQERGPRVT